MRRHNVSAAAGAWAVACVRATMCPRRGGFFVETHTWGPRPAILNDLSRGTRRPKAMGYNWRRKGQASDVRGSRPGRCRRLVEGGRSRAEEESGGMQMMRQVEVFGVSVSVQPVWPGELGSPGLWNFFRGKKPPQRPTAWSGSVRGSAAPDWL